MNIIKFLIDADFDFTMKDRWGRTPLDEASNEEIKLLIKEHLEKGKVANGVHTDVKIDYKPLV